MTAIKQPIARIAACRTVKRRRQNGFTLFEVMVAVLLLAMVSSMIYSILNVSIKFSEKGDKRILRMEREQGLLSLLHRQIKSGWYDERRKQVIISADEDVLRIVTRSPLLYPFAGVVLAIYRYDPADQALYYLEKQDFFNADYEEDYMPSIDDMVVLMENCLPLSFSYPEDSSSVTITYDGRDYEIAPWCQVSSREDAI